MSSRFKPIKMLMLESGEQFPYDKLIIATGSVLINLAGQVRFQGVQGLVSTRSELLENECPIMTCKELSSLAAD
jgi:hypothetical protein